MKKTRTGSKNSPFLVTLLVAAAAVLSLGYLFVVSGNVLLRFFLAIVVLVVSGSAIAKANGIRSSYGAYLLGGRRGIEFIDSLASRNKGLWKGMADWGLAFGFGLLSLPMFRRYLSKKMFLLGMATILVTLIFVFPYLPVVLSFINIPQISNAVGAGSGGVGSQGASLLYYALIAVGIIGGFSLFTVVVILYAGGGILLGILEFIAGYASSNPNYSLLSSQIPGVAPIIPGHNHSSLRGGDLAGGASHRA